MEYQGCSGKHREAVMLSTWLQESLAALKARSTPDGHQKLRHLIEAEGPSLLNSIVGDSLSVRGRTQMGSPAGMSSGSVSFPVESGASAQKGYYIVYLFAKDASAVDLSLACGTERIKITEAKDSSRAPAKSGGSQRTRNRYRPQVEQV